MCKHMKHVCATGCPMPFVHHYDTWGNVCGCEFARLFYTSLKSKPDPVGALVVISKGDFPTGINKAIFFLPLMCTFLSGIKP